MKCKKKRQDDPDESEKEQRPQAKVLNAWESWAPQDGEREPSTEDKALMEKRHNLEQSIEHLKSVPGQEATV